MEETDEAKRKERQAEDQRYFGRLYLKFAEEDFAAGEDVGCWEHLFKWAELGSPDPS